MSPPLPPNLQRWQQAIQRRLSNLERRITADTGDDDGGDSPPVIAWGVTGALTTGRSHDQDMWIQTTLTTFMARLDTAGSTNTVVEARRNGVAVATLTILAGALTGSVAVNANYSPSDTYSAAVTSAGTGASDLQTTAVFG